METSWISPRERYSAEALRARYGVIHHVDDWSKPTGGTMESESNYDTKLSSYPGMGETHTPGVESKRAPEETYHYLQAVIKSSTKDRERASETAMALEEKLDETRSLIKLLTRNIEALVQARDMVATLLPDKMEHETRNVPSNQWGNPGSTDSVPGHGPEVMVRHG